MFRSSRRILLKNYDDPAALILSCIETGTVLSRNRNLIQLFFAQSPRIVTENIEKCGIERRLVRKNYVGMQIAHMISMIEKSINLTETRWEGGDQG